MLCFQASLRVCKVLMTLYMLGWADAWEAEWKIVRPTGSSMHSAYSQDDTGAETLQ